VTIKSWILSTLAGAALTVAQAGELTWLTDLPKAQTLAKTEKKAVLVVFTGSDWCPPCMKLKAEVLDSAEFQKYAKEKLVLVELDFPRKKTLPDDQKKANAALRDKYQVRGFPTLLLLGSDGAKLGQKVGYGGTGPAAVIKELNEFAAGK